MSKDRKTVFLLDVDNTLLDNDRIESDFKHHLDELLGPEGRNRYWEIFEALRLELEYADYLGAVQRYRVEQSGDPRILAVASFLIDYPFAERLYSGALKSIERLARLGRPVILSDGDAVLQPRKVSRSGIGTAAEGHVLIYIHKEKMLEDVERRYPADHYVMVDDKLRVLTAMKQIWKDRLTTVFVRQGHYANDPAVMRQNPPPDLAIEGIAELAEIDLASRLKLAGLTSS